MKSKLNMERLSKPELLMLFSVLEGELEARDLVIEALKAQRKDLFVQERYGRYDVSDPFLALQRDGEALGQKEQQKEQGYSSSTSNPLVVLRLVVSHCRRMQDKMLAQLAAAESRHRRVIADLEEEKRRHAEDTAEGDDVTYVLEKERERLQQQLDFERGQVRRLEKEQRRLAEQLEEERSQHKQLSCALAKECKWASSRALEEGHRLAEMNRKLDKVRESCHVTQKELEEERRKALRMEARVEEQLAEFDTEREQLRSRIRKEEAHRCELQLQVDDLRRKLAEATRPSEPDRTVPAGDKPEVLATKVHQGKPTAVSVKSEDPDKEGHRLPPSAKVNGHHCPAEATGLPGPHPETERLQNGNDVSPLSPAASPNPSRRQAGSHGCQAPAQKGLYQAGINQRFHAARHKFQSPPEGDMSSQAAASPKEHAQAAVPSNEHAPAALTSKEPAPVPSKQPGPTSAPSKEPASATVPSMEPALVCVPSKESAPAIVPSKEPAPASVPSDPSPVKQLARSTVTQVLSRFTSAQPKHAALNNSPFGTDYRTLAAPLSPVTGRASGPGRQGVKSPTMGRAERGNPPPIPPKKPGLAQAPSSPATTPKSRSQSSCGLTSSQDGVKELDLVVSSS